MSERKATTTQHTTVERFAVYDVEGTQFSCMHFEKEEGLRALVHASNVAEQQVPVRLDVDADDMSIVSVNSSPSYGHDGAQRMA